MKTKNKVWEHYKEILNDTDYKNVKACDFFANVEGKNKRVYMAEVMGLDHTDHPNCHVNVSLYYDTHLALTISFATKHDAWEYVNSRGKIDRRIIKKEFAKNGWKLELKAVA